MMLDFAAVHRFTPEDMDKMPLGSDDQHRRYNAGPEYPFMVLPKGWRVQKEWRDDRGNHWMELGPYHELGGTNTLADEAVSTE